MQKKQKMCWNCDGNVSVEALYCPFCGSDLHSQEKAKEHAMMGSSTPSGQYGQETPLDTQNLSSLYKPPYSPTHSGFGVPSYQETPQEPPMEEQSDEYYYPNAPDEPVYPREQPHVNTGYEEEEEVKKTDVGIWPLLFLAIGVNLLTLGLLLFFFADQGRVVLEWNSYFWFVYCILSIPLLMFGWKLLQASAPEEPEE
ncbi:MAG: hypothetical protein S4CHLAM37_01740 [Chlamydiia bacterium]|nr:hypothetical protein [Chlamydiia bacterium]